METQFEIEVEVKETVSITVDIYDLISGINRLPVIDRWNKIAHILNGIEADISDIPKEKLEVIEKFLIKKIDLLTPHTAGEDAGKTE